MQLVLGILLKWIVNAAGLWLAVQLFDTDGVSAGFADDASVFLVAGLILTVVNMVLRPIIALISLPITILTLGLFTVIVNGLMVYIALQLTPDIEITFGHAIIAGVIIGIVNFVMNGVTKALGGKA